MKILTIALMLAIIGERWIPHRPPFNFDIDGRTVFVRHYVIGEVVPWTTCPAIATARCYDTEEKFVIPVPNARERRLTPEEADMLNKELYDPGAKATIP